MLTLIGFALMIGATAFFAMGSGTGWKRTVIAALSGQIVGMGVITGLHVFILEPNFHAIELAVPVPFAIAGAVIGAIHNRVS